MVAIFPSATAAVMALPLPPEANTIISDSMDNMADANERLQYLIDTIRRDGMATVEQRNEIRALRREISKAASKIPLLVGNKSVIVR